MKKLSRRDFIRTSSLVAAGVLAGACAPQPTPTTLPNAEPTTTAPPQAAEATKAVATAAPPQAAEATKAVATAAPKAKYQEAPILAELVKAGKLPPVDQRLPVEPLVVDRTGKYGGMVRTMVRNDQFFEWEGKSAGMMNGLPMRLTPDLRSVVPNMWTGIEVSEDFKTITCHLRKGLRWSDGEPHTVDDWVFWYEDVLLNTELTPAPGSWFTVGGKVMNLVKIDDYNFRLEFAAANPSFPTLNLGHVYGLWDDNALPAHYLKQFHIKYNSQVKDLAKQNNFDSWTLLFASKQSLNTNIECPRMAAFIADKSTTGTLYTKRNPYYWAVDSEGKQLPYFDGFIEERISQVPVIEAKTAAGEYDFVGSWYLQTSNIPSYKEGEAKGNYRVETRPSGKASQFVYNVNMNYPDEVWRKVFSDVRFRQALSVAINRAEVNEVLYFGQGIPSQLTAHPTSRVYKKEYAQAWAQYDPAKANSLLDEMGLKWDEAHKVRLLSNGQPAHISFELVEISPMHDMVIGYWGKVGIQVDYKSVSSELNRNRIIANQAMMSTWPGDECMDSLLLRRPKFFVPIYDQENTWAPLWGQWYATKGAQGEEPPADIKQLFDWEDKYNETNDPQYADKILASQAENIWCIGVVCDPPIPLIFNNDIKNVIPTSNYAWDGLWGWPDYPDAWYFDR